METFMNGAMLIETALLSFLLALWISWLGLRGLFRLMPAGKPEAAAIRTPLRRGSPVASRHAA